MKIIVQNLAIEYLDEGAGKVVLFLHGWGDNLRTFDLISKALSENFRVVRLDFPGFGKSEAPPFAWNLDTYIQFVHDFVEKLNLEVSMIVGHSFGGRVIIKGIANGHLHSEKIVLISSAGVARRNLLRVTVMSGVAKIFALLLYIPPILFWREKIRTHVYTVLKSDYHNAGLLKPTFLNIISENLRGYARRVTVPTLLIWGSQDTVTPPSEGLELSMCIIGSRLEVIHDAGHFVHSEEANKVLMLINNFFHV